MVAVGFAERSSVDVSVVLRAGDLCRYSKVAGLPVLMFTEFVPAASTSCDWAAS
jgi:hypothetical protein